VGAIGFDDQPRLGAAKSRCRDRSGAGAENASRSIVESQVAPRMRFDIGLVASQVRVRVGASCPMYRPRECATRGPPPGERCSVRRTFPHASRGGEGLRGGVVARFGSRLLVRVLFAAFGRGRLVHRFRRSHNRGCVDRSKRRLDHDLSMVGRRRRRACRRRARDEALDAASRSRPLYCPS